MRNLHGKRRYNLSSGTEPALTRISPYFPLSFLLHHNTMKPAPEIISYRSGNNERATHTPPPRIDYSYQSRGTISRPVSGKTEACRSEVKTFRALSRQFFGIEATREFLSEAILFAGIMIVAAWPLSVTLNQLGTMMISPPHTPWSG